jgi:HD superfamily phosphohydrolase
MKHPDPVYGSIHVTEPVLKDIIRSAAVQRLKGVMQHGITALIGLTEPITRFEHSMGVMVLVKRLGAPLEEQIAALLHDVSHTVFSHVIDYVYDGHDSQSYHDEKKEEYMSSTDLPDVLADHGYDWHDFVDEERYPLLEQPSPRLCADRLDYFLRDSLPLGLAEDGDIQMVLEHLVVVDGRVATSTVEAAQWLGHTYMAADEASWANFREVGLYEIMARAIKKALHLGIIDESDFWLTDEVTWDKLQAQADPALAAQLSLVSRETQFAWDENAPTFRVSTKLRAIDPDVVVEGELRPLSTLDPDFADHRAAYLTRKRGKWPMRVIPGDQKAATGR